MSMLLLRAACSLLCLCCARVVQSLLLCCCACIVQIVKSDSRACYGTLRAVNDEHAAVACHVLIVVPVLCKSHNITQE